jgi:hypothetical protein
MWSVMRRVILLSRTPNELMILNGSSGAHFMMTDVARQV